MLDLHELILQNEKALLDQVRIVLKERGYVECPSQPIDQYHDLFAGLPTTLISASAAYDTLPLGCPANEATDDPLALFGAEKAKKCRNSGGTLPMFIGAAKCYRQVYIDLVMKSDCMPEDKERYRQHLDLFFDKIELASIGEWGCKQGQQSETAANSSEQKFHALFEAMIEGVSLHELVRDPDGKPVDYRILDINPAYEKHTGIIARNVRGALASEVYGAGGPPYIDIYARVVESGQPCAFETYFAPLKRHFSIRVFSLEKNRFATVFEDITERKMAEEALLESETRFRRIADAVTDYIYTVFLDRGKVRETRHGLGCLAVTGYREDEFIADPFLWFNMVFAEDRDAVRDQARLVATGKEARAIEHRIIRKDGVVRWVRNTTIPRHDSHGNLLSYDGLIKDITERKNAEQAIHSVEKRFRDMLENIHLAAVMLDRDCNLTFCNDYLLGLTGWSRTEVLHKNWFDRFVPAKARDALKTSFNEGIAHASLPPHYENPIIARDGSERLIVWDNTLLIDPDGIVTGVASIGTDVTEHRMLEEQLRHAQKMEAIGTLAGGVAHDFNNILTAITGYAHIVMMKTGDEDPHKHYLKEIMNATQRAATLTQSLLAFSRKRTVDLKSLDINELVKRSQKLFARLLREDIELKTVFDDKPLPVIADSGQIEQVLMNLLVNARDAMPESGRLTIETGLVELDDSVVRAEGLEMHGEYAHISVTDTGAGMDETTRNRIFEPFFTTKETGKGTGLGLAIVYGILKKHNGFINVRSEPGAGTSFHIYLPIIRVAAEPRRSADMTLVPARGGTETILIAEDDEEMRKLFAVVLRLAGYTVIEAVDGEDAVAIFAGNGDAIRLIILDRIMPKKNGKEAFEIINALRPDVKVIFMSGYPDEMFNRDGTSIDDKMFILKPVSPNDFLEKVRSVLDA